MKSEPPKKLSLLVCYVARVCQNSKDAEQALQESVQDYKLTEQEQAEVRTVLKEEQQAGLIQR